MLLQGRTERMVNTYMKEKKALPVKRVNSSPNEEKVYQILQAE